ncbi:MAG: three-Cys-motif partner protein TcmP [Polyangiales bacterium]
MAAQISWGSSMSNEKFFTEQREQSLVKSTIVSKYFGAWARIILPQTRAGRIAYLDLFAGPGRYEEGAESTPIMVLRQAIADPKLRASLVTIFNDRDEKNCTSLQRAISEIEGIEGLKHPSQVMNKEVGTEMVKLFESMNLVPTLFFVDPWGYKGLSLKLINSVLQNWGCDGVFFLNYNRVNAGLSNPLVKPHMEALFGVERAEALRARVEGLSPRDRETAVIEELAQALHDLGGRYVLPFQFRNNDGTRTSHYLVFVSKNVLGYKLMKDIMAKESSLLDQGVPSFSYCPADERFPLLFLLNRPLDALGPMLCDEYAGRSLTVGQLFMEHNVGRPYILRNYQEVLRDLEARGVVTIDPPASQRPSRKGVLTLAEKCRVSFPRGSS